MTATAIRVLDDSAGTILADTRDSYLQGLTFNATADRFFWMAPYSSTTNYRCCYAESDLSAAGRTVTGYVNLLSTATGYVSTPDHADFDVPTDGVIDVRADVAISSYTGSLDAWSIAKWGSTAVDQSWGLGWDQVTETIQWTWRDDSQVQTTHNSSSSLGFTAKQRIQIRAVHDTAGGTDSIAFYYRTDGILSSDTGWTAAGTASPSATTIIDGAAVCWIGELGGPPVSFRAYGGYVKINGSLKADPDFTNTSFAHTDSTGKSWSLINSAPYVLGYSLGAANRISAASDDGDYVCTVYTNAAGTGYNLGRTTLSTELDVPTIQTWSPTAVSYYSRIGCTGTNSFVILYHGPTEKVMGTNYDRLYYRTYVPSTDTLGSETIVSGAISQSGVQASFTIVSTDSSMYMRGNYSQDRSAFKITTNPTARWAYYDASAGTWTLFGPSTLNGGPGGVHQYNGGTELLFDGPISGQLGRLDGWADTTYTQETITDAAANNDNLVAADHANSETYLTQVSSTTNVRRKKRSSGGTWDSSWTDDTITLTSATGVRTDVSNDARYFPSVGGGPVLVRTAVTNQSSGRGLHLIKISLSTGTTHSGAGSANQANQATSSGSTALRAQSTANQANQALASASLTVLAAGSANTASDTTANGSTAALREGQGSADSAVEASATAVVVRSAVGSANSASEASGTASVVSAGAATANSASDATGVASVGRLAAAAANQAVEATAVGSTAALKSGQGSADSATEATASSLVVRPATGSANQAVDATATVLVDRLAAATANSASDSSAVALTERFAAGSANQAAEATAVGSTVALGQGSADTAAEATATASITYQAAGSANQATDTTAAGSIAGTDTGQGSANNATTATATGSVLHQAATTANTANIATGQSSIALYAAGAANQAETTSSVASVARFGAGSAAAAADVISIGSRQFGAAGTAALACQVVAQFNLFVSLYANGDGTGANVVDENDLTTNIWQSIDDDPRSPTDTDWINNTAVTGSKFIALTNLPSAFGNADVARVQARYRGAQFGSGTVTLYAQLFQSDESTSLSDEVAVSAVTSDGSFENTSELVLTGLNTSADKTVWDDALIRFRWETT